LPADLVPLELAERLRQAAAQLASDLPGHRLLGTHYRVAPKLLLELATLVPVHPAENTRELWRRQAIGDPVTPVLGEPVLLGERLQSRLRDGQLHVHVRFLVTRVVLPQAAQRFLHAHFT